MSTTNPNENRLKLLVVPQQEVLDLLVSQSSLPQFLSLANCAGIPTDCHVISVHNDPCMQAFCFVLRHHSFEEVPPGREIPRVWLDDLETARVVVELPSGALLRPANLGGTCPR